MSVRKIISPTVPEPAGAIYSNCLVLGDQIFIAGQTAGGPDGKATGGSSMEAQARACFSKIKSLLEAAGGGMSDIVKMTVYVTDMALRPDFGRVRNEFFPGNTKPCSTLVEVSALAGADLLIEVDVTAIRGAGRA
jgi:enamine deaminase RidA (YjgF/YER057c/UK114 family)